MGHVLCKTLHLKYKQYLNSRLKIFKDIDTLKFLK